MKLRMQGNAIRLRLSRGEVARFHETGRVEDAIQFPGGTGLTWILQSSDAVPELQALFDNGDIRVMVPPAQASAWATSDDVGIYSAAAASPSIAIEKDFQCLHDPATGHRDDADAFPNPAAQQNRHGKNPAS